MYNEDQQLFSRPAVPLADYLASGHFWQATGENWESEFLQMGFYVVLTVFLFQKGSAESKDPDDPSKNETPASHKAVSWVYRNFLTLAFIALFCLSFAVHAVGGLREENEQRSERHQATVSLKEFVTSSTFWFQSFQNWQSEFLAVLAIVTLTVFLRQEGSPESKAVGDPNSKTGK